MFQACFPRVPACHDVPDDTILTQSPSACRYSAYNMSAARLPKGLAFSSQLRSASQPASNAASLRARLVGGSQAQTYPGLLCPYLRLESDPDEAAYLLSNLHIDPEYSLFQGCRCDQVIERG